MIMERPTAQLRWEKRRHDGGHFDLVLQQRWEIKYADQREDQARREWRDVPIVEDEVVV